MPTYVHCPTCRRAYDAAAPCPVCPAPAPRDDARLSAALDEVARLREALADLARRVDAPPQAIVRVPPTRTVRGWAEAVAGSVARALGSARRAWSFARA